MKPSCYFISISSHEAAVPKHFRALAAELVARGHRVVLLLDGGHRKMDDHRANPAIYTWPSKRPTKLRDALFLLRLVRRYHPSCMMATFGSINVMMLMGWLLRVPCRVAWYFTLTTQIDTDTSLPHWKMLLLRLRKRMIYGMATLVVSNSKAGDLDLQQAFRVPSRKCRVLYLSLPDPFQQDGLAETIKPADKLVCVGRLHPTKGQDVIIRALPLLPPELDDVCVEFVGDGPARDFCVQLAQELKVQHRVEFVGAVPPGEVSERMASATAVIVPSRTECFGLVNVHSLSVGTPLVASRVGGIGEIIDDGVEGFLVPPEDPPRLAEKLRELLLHPELREQMGQKGRRRFLHQFEQDKVIAAQADWCEEIIS